jgi:hypothetical protein
MEATGGYESLLVKRQHEHPMARAAVNPRQVPDFAQGLASPQAAQSGEHIKLRSLVERRRKLHDLGSHEQNRLLETMDAKTRKSIPTMLSLLPGRRRMRPTGQMTGLEHRPADLVALQIRRPDVKQTWASKRRCSSQI